MEDFPARVIAEVHVFEAHARAAGLQRDGAGGVLYVLAFVQQAEQPLHVGQRLFHLAVHHPQHEQRRGELQQVGVHQHQVADGQLAGHHAGSRAPHHRGDADGDDGGLAQVQQRQGLGGLDPRVLQEAQVLVVARRLVGFVVEVLHRLVVEQ
ncbi:hypothetical protein D9M73_219910 [compost metagenome]